MKKFLSLVICFVLVVSMLPQTALFASAATSGTCGDNLTWTLDDSGTLTISGTGDMADFTSKSPPWSSLRSSINRVIIEDGITHIGSCAFWYSSKLTSVTIPGSITSIGDDAFNSCNSLSSVNITDLAAWCKIDFYASGSNPLSCANNLYLNGSLVTDLVIPNDVTSIGKYAFYNCDSLTSVTIPDSVTSIGAYAFSLCDGLTSIIIPDSVTSIGAYAFSYCSNLQSIALPNSITSIGLGTFRDCDSLTSITIPDSVTSIGSDAFYDCDSLTSITIPDSVTSIGEYAFLSCDSLTSVNITDLAAWCKIYFYAATSNPLYYAKNLYLNDDLVTDMIIPDSVTSIGKYAFYNCDSLTSVTIPDSVTSIGAYAFSDCSSLTSVTIPDSVTSIGLHAFYKCTSLQSITIPNSITSINEDTFYGCTSLTSVTIPDSVTSIDSSAFYGCTSLTRVNITDLAAWCKIYFDAATSNPLYYAKNLYLNDDLVTDMIIPDSVTSIGVYAFYNCDSLTSVLLPDNMTRLNGSTFYGCSNLKAVWQNKVEKIGNNAFYGCESLEYVYYNGTKTPYSDSTNRSTNTDYFGAKWVEKCGDRLSYSLDDYGTLTIFGTGDMYDYYDKYESIPWYSSRHSIKNIIIDAGVTSIGADAFYACKFTSIDIPDSVTSIGTEAFIFSGLTSVTIPDSVTSIGESAFRYNYDLTSVYYLGTPAQWDKISIGSENHYLTNATRYFPVLGVSLNKTKTALLEGKKETLSVTFNPPNVINSNIIWESSDASVATVNNGVVTGIAPGKTTITATTEDGGYTASCEVSVLTSGTAGNNISWTLSPDCVLTISGSGSVKNYWEDYIPYIKEIVIENGITDVYYEAFYDYVNLEKVTLPETLTKIYGSAFEGCGKLTTLNLPSSLTEIEDYAFYNCNKISDVYYADSNKKWDAVTIGEDNGSLLSADYHFGIFLAEGITLDKSETEIYVGSSDTLTPIFIPAETTNKSVTWSSSNTKIATVENGVVTAVAPGVATITVKTADGGYTADCTVYVPYGEGVYGSLLWKLDALGNLTVSGTGEMTSGTMPWSTYATDIKTVVIENGVTSIAASAFANCINLESASIADSVITINDGAFSACSALKNIELPGNITEIAAATFENCSGLENITLHNKVAAIRSAAFSGCTSLTDVHYKGAESEWNSISIRSGNDAIKNATIHFVKPFAPTFSDSMNANLTLEANVFLNIYFMLENLDGVDPATLEDRVGLLIWDADNLSSDATYENCDRIVNGAKYSASMGYYKAQTEGIPAKELGDAISFRAYFRNDDGTYTYGRIVSNYCPSVYCYRQLQDSSAADDELMITILNYGAAAQEFFNYRTDSLMNKDLTDAQKAISWDGSLVRSDWSVPANKAGSLVMNNKITMRSANLTLLGAIDYNYYIGVNSSINVASAKILCWTEADYNAATVLTKENASLIADMEYNSTNNWYEYKYAGLPAKEMFSPIYTCAVITDTQGNEYYGGVVAYCPERFAYISTNSNVSEAEKNLAKCIVIYGNAARKFFNK